VTRSPAAHLTAICIAVRWGVPGGLSSRRCANWTFPYGVMPVCKTVGDFCRPLTFVAGPRDGTRETAAAPRAGQRDPRIPRGVAYRSPFRSTCSVTTTRRQDPRGISEVTFTGTGKCFLMASPGELP
jgi:hypothetical protein